MTTYLSLRHTLALLFSLLPLICTAAHADNTGPSAAGDTSPPVYSVADWMWGGHLRGLGIYSQPNADSLIGSVKEGPYYDGSLEFRLKNEIKFQSDWRLDIHYEAVYSGGDLREATRMFSDSASSSVINGFLPGPPIDDTRLFDLTAVVREADRSVLYHRLDRLALTATPPWGTVRIGRQALTWGNGLLFNPMDLFNPFAPTDVLRDYKLGDDMAAATVLTDAGNELQFLYVPRRDPSDGDVKWDRSSAAAKFHGTLSGIEFDAMAARHYEDPILGLGGIGYLMAAAWRADITFTLPDEHSGHDGFFSAVANIDYSWIWGGRNCYGFLEFYYNGLGDNDYSDALRDEELVERIARGEIFTLGTTYISGTFQLELHPLVNFYLTAINNIHDPSGVLQPRIIWDAKANLQITTGAAGNWGAAETEFGGFDLPGTDLRFSPLNNVYLWITCYF